MLQAAGFLIVLIVVMGGLAMSGGPAILSALPFELALIGGAAIGTVLIGNAPSVAREAFTGMGRALTGAKWKRADYTGLFTLMHTLLQRVRRGGFIAIEADIEDPENSALFQSQPGLAKDPAARALICDSFRLMALDPSTRSETGRHLQDTVADLVEERQKAVSALHTLADALPALGIVAAVLGIIKTMGMIDQSTAILGEMIAAALLGTFLGVFLAYGLVGPMANRYGQIVEEEALYLDAIARIISAFSQDVAPRTTIELARSALPVHLRPDMIDLDQSLKVVNLEAARKIA